MFITLLLLLVPMTALGLVLGMDRLEDSLLRAPARHRGTGTARAAAADALAPASQPVVAAQPVA
jgi:hypothetical protein